MFDCGPADDSQTARNARGRHGPTGIIAIGIGSDDVVRGVRPTAPASSPPPSRPRSPTLSTTPSTSPMRHGHTSAPSAAIQPTASRPAPPLLHLRLRLSRRILGESLSRPHAVDIADPLPQFGYDQGCASARLLPLGLFRASSDAIYPVSCPGSSLVPTFEPSSMLPVPYSGGLWSQSSRLVLSVCPSNPSRLACNVLIFAITVTSLAAGRIGDSIGRRGTLFSGAVVFALGGALQTFTNGFNMMCAGRIVSGFGVGLLS